MGSLQSSSKESLGFTEIETTAASLHRSDIFHVVKEILGFILYMHQQIPAVLRHLEHEFHVLKEDYKELELPHYGHADRKDKKSSFLRKNNMRKMEMKLRIKMLEKLMSSISTLLSAIQGAIDESPNFQGVTFVLGGSLVHPQYVYEVLFSNLRENSGSAQDNSRSKVAEVLSRKAVRALISNGAGSSYFSGPTKLFLLIKSPCTFNLPLHFLPKRDFRYNKKTMSVKLQIKCKFGDEDMMNNLHYTTEKANSSASADINLTDMIWYQCRHTVKGLAFKFQGTEC